MKLSDFCPVFSVSGCASMRLYAHKALFLLRPLGDSNPRCRRERASDKPIWRALAVLLSGFWAVSSLADTWTASTDKLRDYIIIRPKGHPSGGTLAVCRVPLYDVTAGTVLTVNAWGNFTNDSGIENAGLTCEVHLCEPTCVKYDSAGRFDRLGGVATNGGANLTKDRHHEVINRYGRIEIGAHAPELRIELQCRAYNKNVSGNKQRITVDGCGVDVQQW